MRDVKMYVQLHIWKLFSFIIGLLCTLYIGIIGVISIIAIIAFSSFNPFTPCDVYATTSFEQYALQRSGSSSSISLQTIHSKDATAMRELHKTRKMHEIRKKIKLTKKQQILRDSLDKLDIHQFRILVTTFAKAHAFDLHYTMTAIAWHESAFGKHPINLADPSFGVFHNLITSVMDRVNSKDNNWNRSRIAERLVLDYDFSFSQALAELEFWKSYYTSRKASNVWSKTVMSYNAGYNYQKGKAYLKEIKDKVKALKAYVQDHQHIFAAILHRLY